MVQDGPVQRNFNHFFSVYTVFSRQFHRMLFRAEQPAVGYGDFFQVILSVRVHAGEYEAAVAVRNACRH